MSKKTARGIAFLSLFAFLLVGCPTGLKLLKILFPSISIEDKTKELVQKYLGDRFSLGNVLTNGVTLPVNIPGVGNLEWSFEGGSVTVDTNGAVTVDTGASDGTVTGTVSFTVLGEKITLPIPFDLKQTPSGIDAYKLALSSIQNTIDEKVLSSPSTIDLLTKYSGPGASTENPLTITYTIGGIKELEYDNNGKLKMARDIQDKRVEVPVTLSGIEVEAPSTQRAAGPTTVTSLDYTIPLLIPRIDAMPIGDNSIEFADGAIYVVGNNNGATTNEKTVLSSIGVNYGSTTVTFSSDTPGTTDQPSLSGSFTASVQKATLAREESYLVTKKEAYDKLEHEAKQFVEMVVSNEKDLPRLYTEFKVKNGDLAALRKALLTTQMNAYIDLLNIYYFEGKRFEYTIEKGQLSLSIPYDSKRTWFENLLFELNGRATSDSGSSLHTSLNIKIEGVDTRYATLVLGKVGKGIELLGTVQGDTITFAETDRPTYTGSVTVTDNKDGTFAIRGRIEPAKSDSPSASGVPTEPIEINETLRFEGEDGLEYLNALANI